MRLFNQLSSSSDEHATSFEHATLFIEGKPWRLALNLEILATTSKGVVARLPTKKIMAQIGDPDFLLVPGEKYKLQIDSDEDLFNTPIQPVVLSEKKRLPSEPGSELVFRFMNSGAGRERRLFD